MRGIKDKWKNALDRFDKASQDTALEGVFQWIRDWRRGPAKELKSHRTQAAEYGGALPRSYAGYRLKGTVIWASELTPYYPENDPSDTSNAPDDDPSKGHFRASFAIAFAGNQQTQFSRVYANGKKIRSTGPNNAANPYAGKIRFYPGSETQTPDPTIEAIEGAGNVPAYRGVCYLVFKDFPLQEFGDEIPEITADFLSGSTSDFTANELTNLDTIASGDEDNFVVSHNTPLLYSFSDGVLQVMDRNNREVYVRRDISTLAQVLSGSKISIDEAVLGLIEPVYFLCEDTFDNSSFILKFFGPYLTNHTDRIVGAEESECFVSGQFLYTADRANGSQVRCYNKTTLARIWSRPGPNASAKPGNFTRDNFGNLWLISYLDADADRFYLSRITPGGITQHYTYTGLSRCKSIAIEIQSHRMFVGGDSGDLNLLTVPASGAPVFIDSNGATTANLRPLFVSQFRCNDTFWTFDGTHFSEIEASSFATRQTITLASYGAISGLKGFAYSQPEHAFWALRSSFPYGYQLLLERFSSDPPSIGAILSDICEQAGLQASEIDTTDLSSDLTIGYGVLERNTAVGALQPLLDAFLLDVRESFQSGYPNIKLQFIKRGGSVVASIPEDDLGAFDSAPPDTLITEERDDEESLPRRVVVHYVNAEEWLYGVPGHMGPFPVQQKAEWPIDSIAARGELDLQLPVAMSDDMAAQLADKVLNASYVESNRKLFTLPPKYLYLEAGDSVNVTYNGETFRVRLESVDLGANWILECAGVLEDVSVYDSIATGASVPESPDLPLATPSRAFFLDIPIVRDADDNPGWYGGAAPLLSSGTWPGSQLRRSDNGLSYDPVIGFSSAVSWGLTTDALPSGDTYAWDRDSTVTVEFFSGAPSSLTEADLVANRLNNLAAIGTEETGWELVQFATVTPLGDNVYTLSDFLRGRFGTEWRVGLHTFGESVVLLDFDTPTIRRINTPLGDLGKQYIYRCPTALTSTLGAAPVSFTNTGIGLKPYSPSQVRGVRGFTKAENWTLYWFRRSRVGADLQDEVEIPLGEATERYEVDILDGSGGPVLRTLTVGPGLPVCSGVNLSVNGTTRIITRASGSFLTDGFFPEQWVDGAGFTNAANNNRYQILAVSSMQLEIDPASLTTPLVTEASASGRTITACSPAVLYEDTDQIADFGSVQASFYVRVYQISTSLETANIDNGRGYSEETLIEE